VNHPSDKGDGVRVLIVSSEQGVLGEWAARHGSVPVHLERVTVKRGETLDFVADCRQTVEFDSFHWAPVLREVAASGRSGSASGAFAEWNARADFRGPVKPAEKRALSAWEKYAQVLLLANEMAFVD
jgi:hypothetical protein